MKMRPFVLGTRFQPARPTLGQLIPEPLLDDFAKKLAEAAAPEIRSIVQEERERLAVSLQKGIPWAGASAISLLATRYVVPEKMATGKFIGYSAAVILMLIGVGVITAASREAAA